MHDTCEKCCNDKYISYARRRVGGGWGLQVSIYGTPSDAILLTPFDSLNKISTGSKAFFQSVVNLYFKLSQVYLKLQQK